MNCIVCKNHGLPEHIWKSHYVRQSRDPKSMVTCPTILNNKCSYCGTLGHLLSYCPTMKKDKKCEKQEAFTIKREMSKVQNLKKEIVSNVRDNSFALLNMDDDSDTEEDNKEEHVVIEIRPKRKLINWFDTSESDTEDEDEEE